MSREEGYIQIESPLPTFRVREAESHLQSNARALGWQLKRPCIMESQSYCCSVEHSQRGDYFWRSCVPWLLISLYNCSLTNVVCQLFWCLTLDVCLVSLAGFLGRCNINQFLFLFYSSQWLCKGTLTLAPTYFLQWHFLQQLICRETLLKKNKMVGCNYFHKISKSVWKCQW